MKTVAVINHKGGVGKTTFTGNVAQALALCGFSVLAIDNDSQHNLSSMLCPGTFSPTIADMYRATATQAPGMFLRAIRKTEVDGLHVVVSDRRLREHDVQEILSLRHCMGSCSLERFYDFCIIDNAPGMDRLQLSAIHSAEEIFVPTELRQFAVDGIAEMERMLLSEYPDAASITKIIPNFFRNTKRDHTFIHALKHLFGPRVTETAIPWDPVFDECITENKILFLHRLASKGAAYYLKIIHELFALDEDELWEQIIEKRSLRRSEEARERFYASMIKKTHQTQRRTDTQ
jgi:chromosome partitioning protein